MWDSCARDSLHFINFTSIHISREKCLDCKQTGSSMLPIRQTINSNCVHVGLVTVAYFKRISIPHEIPSLPPDSPHLVSRPLSITPCFCCPSSHSKTSSEGLHVPVLTRGDIPKVVCFRPGSPGFFQIGVCRPGGVAMGAVFCGCWAGERAIGLLRMLTPQIWVMRGFDRDGRGCCASVMLGGTSSHGI